MDVENARYLQPDAPYPVDTMHSIVREGHSTLQSSLTHSIGALIDSRMKNLESQIFGIAEQNRKIFVLLNSLLKPNLSNCALEETSNSGSPEPEKLKATVGDETQNDVEQTTKLPHIPCIALSSRMTAAANQHRTMSSEDPDYLSQPSKESCLSAIPLLDARHHADDLAKASDHKSLFASSSAHSYPKIPLESERRSAEFVRPASLPETASGTSAPRTAGPGLTRSLWPSDRTAPTHSMTYHAATEPVPTSAEPALLLRAPGDRSAQRAPPALIMASATDSA